MEKMANNMEFREWKEEFNLNLPKIDDHHKKFLDVINLLIKVTNERSCEEEINIVFFRLVYFVENYFVDEEIYFKEYGYENFKQHKEEHNKFIRQIIKFQEEYKEHDRTVCGRMLKYLSDWFDEHVLGYDKEAANYLLGMMNK